MKERTDVKPWRKSPIAVLAIVILLLAYFHAFDALWPDALGAEGKPTHAKICTPDPEVACPNAPDGQDGSRYTKKFNDGDYDNSHGQHFSDGIKDKIRNWYDNHPNAKLRAQRKGNGHWWNFEFEQLACAPQFGAGYHVNCENGAEHRVVWDRYNLAGAKIIVRCSGAAIFVLLASGSEAGAGIAGGGCFFDKAMDVID